MKQTTKVLLSAILTIAMCVSVISGATFALFTSEASTNIAVNAGTVKVEAKVENLKLYSMNVEQTESFENGGTAEINEKTGVLTLDKVTPGDKAEFTINVTNNSNVAIKYRVVMKATGELAPAIVAKATINEKEHTITAEKATTDWVDVAANDPINPIAMSVELPVATNNDYQDKSAEVSVVLEAVQANGVVEEVANIEQLYTAFQTGGDVTLTDNITLDGTMVISEGVSLDLDLNGKTIEGAIFVKDGADVTIRNGEWTNTNADVSAIEINEGKLTLDNVVINSARHGVRVDGKDVEVVIKGGTYKVAPTTNKTLHALNVSGGATVVINGGTFVGPAGTMADSGSAVNVQAGSAVTINGGSFSGGKNNTLASNGTLVVKGGTFDQNPTAFVADGYKVVSNDSNSPYVVVAEDNDSVFVVGEDDELETAVGQENATVVLASGTYTFPSSSIAKGVTIECAEGTVFEGTSSLNINGATVIGATFSSDNERTVTGTVNGTFKNCTFEGNRGLRYCDAPAKGETAVFENCVFDGSVYGAHFDAGEGKLVFKNCSFSGFNAFGGSIEKITFENCTFKSTGKSAYNGVNLWGNSVLENCTFVFDGSVDYEWVDARGDNKTYSFTNCVVTDGKTKKGIETVVGDYGKDNTITIDGVKLATDNDMLTAAVNGGATKVLLADGEYDLKGIQKDGLTLIGVGKNVKMANTTNFASGGTLGAIWKAIHLENVTITNTVYTMEEGGNSTFTNVNFAAGFRQGYGKGVVFTDCTFGSNSDGYALHFQSDDASAGGVITLTDCEFKGGKVHLGGKRTYVFTNCDFAKDTDFQVWSNITLDGCTVGGVAVDASNIATLFPSLNLEKVTLK